MTAPHPIRRCELDLQIQGKTALVLGGFCGLGRAIAAGLALKGVKVKIVARDATRVERTAADNGYLHSI